MVFLPHCTLPRINEIHQPKVKNLVDNISTRWNDTHSGWLKVNESNKKKQNHSVAF